MENCKITELYNLDETIAKDLLSKYTYPWEVLAHINDFILELGATLPTDEYNKIGDDVWVHKTATVFESAYIHGPAIICKDAEVRHCAFIRGKAIVGEGAVVGNSTELYYSIKYKFLITIMLEIQYWDINLIWELAR